MRVAVPLKREKYEELSFICNPKLTQEISMNLKEKIQVIEKDSEIIKKGIGRVVEKYPMPISILVRGNKTGMSVTVDENFDKIPDSVFTQKVLSQV